MSRLSLASTPTYGPAWHGERPPELDTDFNLEGLPRLVSSVVGLVKTFAIARWIYSDLDLFTSILELLHPPSPLRSYALD